MKKLYFSLIFSSFSLLGMAQSNIVFWDFNSVTNDAAPATGSDLPAIGVGSISVIGGVTQTYATGNSADLNTTDNSGYQTTGYPASTLNPKTAGIEVSANATGFNGLKVEFFQRLSNTAANTWVLQYTEDITAGSPVWVDATTFTFTPQSSGTGDTWYFRSVDLSGITTLNNNANVGFRVVSDFDPITGDYLAARSTSTYAGGTCRFDLFRVFEKEAAVSIASASNFVVVEENAGLINVPITIANANQASVELTFGFSTYSNATENVDFTYTNTLTIPANSNGIFDLPITIIDDVIAEKAERIIVKVMSAVNGTIHATNNYQIIFIKDNDYVAPTPTNELNLTLLSSFSNGATGANSAEIVSFDPTVDRLYVANSIAGLLDIVDFADPANPSIISSIDISVYGGINSVVAHNGILALAIENTNPQLDGFVVFLDANGTYINQVTVGALPDMITYNKDFTKLLTANEGEPSGDYSIDPEGSVSVIDMTPGVASLTNANVTNISLTQFNGQESALIAQGIRIFSTSATVAQDLEPEYITISDDNTKAFVALQENNALLIIDLATNTIESLLPLGYSDYSAGSNNAMDASDQSGAVLITGDLPIKGAYMPDGIAFATIGGQGYVFSANEGDSREFGSVVDSKRIGSGSFILDPVAFPDGYILKNNKFLGRLNGLTYSGDTDNDGDMDEIHVMGGRSFSIWNAATGALVFDSKDLFEQITANHPTFGAFFNASNSTSAATLKNRSDDKGPEPEGITLEEINGKMYAFVGLERIGGVMVFNVQIPTAPVFVGYYNNRTLTGNGPDLGTEGIITIPAAISPNGNALVILANEVSSTLSIYQINTCSELSGAVIAATTTTFCEGDDADLTITGDANATFQWLLDGQEITSATSTSYNADEAGVYAVAVNNSLLACMDTSATQTIVVNALPVVSGGADVEICAGESVTLTASGALSYTWDNPVQDGVAFNPTASADYTVIGEDANGCENSATVTVDVNALPTVTLTSNDADNAICTGDAIILTAGGASTYTFTNGVADGVSFVPSMTNTYSVTGEDANGCENTALLTVTVNALPNVTLAAFTSPVCVNNASVTLNGGAPMGGTYSGTAVTGSNFNATTAGVGSTVITYTYTDANGCENTDSESVIVSACTGIEEVATNYIVFPNPVQNQLTIQFEGSVNGMIRIFSLDGKEVEAIQINNENVLNITTDHLANGTYLVQIMANETTSFVKVIKN
jgi:hypothetical protein